MDQVFVVTHVDSREVRVGGHPLSNIVYHVYMLIAAIELVELSADGG